MESHISPILGGNYPVYFVPLPGNKNKSMVVPPIYHPSVSFPECVIDNDDINSFCNDVKFPNPANIDAAVLVHKQASKLISLNANLFKAYKSFITDEECPVCFENNSICQVMCFSFHMVCFQCSKGIKSCPICRFIPVSKRDDLLKCYK